MVTEGEKITSELRQIRLQNTVMMDIQFSQYVLTPAFKSEFKRIPKKTCNECGKFFRVTHWCIEQDTQIWIPNWETIIRTNFKPIQRDKVDIQDIYAENELLLDKQLQNQIQVPSNSRDLSRSQPPKKKLHKKQPISKPQAIPVVYKQKTPIKESNSKQHSKPVIYKPKTTNTQPIQKNDLYKKPAKKLSIQSLVQLSQNERYVYEQLKTWRNTLANRERKQPYMIAVDTTLMAIVFYRVSSTHELLQIAGITPQTAQRYGTDILRIMIRNGMATGIKSYKEHRKPTTVQKIIGDIDPKTKKIIGGFALCFVFIIIIVVLAQI